MNVSKWRLCGEMVHKVTGVSAEVYNGDVRQHFGCVLCRSVQYTMPLSTHVEW